MKKGFCFMLAAVLIAAMMGGCGNVDPTNTTASQEDQFKPLEYSEIYAPGSYQPDSSATPGQSLHYTCDGFFGDVHPFYYDGKMYMFYLSTGRESNSVHQTFSSMLAVSEDMIHYEPVELKMDKKNPPEQDLYYALGVYIDAEGRFRSCYGKGGYVGGSVSDDLLTWSNGAEPYMDDEIGMLRYKYRVTFDSDVYSGRDPYIWYDAASESYYCVVMNYYSAQSDKGAKGLALYIGDKEGRHSSKAVKMVSFTGRGDPECPMLMKIGNRWYLFYSVFGTGVAGSVGRLSYRMGGENQLPQDVDWENAAEYCLDGGDLHAAQLVNVGDKIYMYGWINYAAHQNVWGGFLNLPREVYQKADGTLGSRCDEYLTELLRKESIAQMSFENTALQGVTAEGSEFTAAGGGTATLNQKVGRTLMTAKITLPASGQQAGYTLSDGTYTYFIGVRRDAGKLYLTVRSDSGDGESAYIEILDPGTTEFDLKVISEGRFIEAFVNDAYSVTAHTRLKNGEYTLALSLMGENAAAEDVQIYQLADYNNIYN